MCVYVWGGVCVLGVCEVMVLDQKEALLSLVHAPL